MSQKCSICLYSGQIVCILWVLRLMGGLLNIRAKLDYQIKSNYGRKDACAESIGNCRIEPQDLPAAHPKLRFSVSCHPNRK